MEVYLIAGNLDRQVFDIKFKFILNVLELSFNRVDIGLDLIQIGLDLIQIGLDLIQIGLDLIQIGLDLINGFVQFILGNFKIFFSSRILDHESPAFIVFPLSVENDSEFHLKYQVFLLSFNAEIPKVIK